MKKNLLSIVILALLIVNLVLTSVMMFSVMSTNKKTGAVVSDIASILKLELGEAGEDEAAASAVSMEDTDVYNIEEEMTILLAKGADGEEHYALVQASLSMDTKNKDYKTYGATLDEKVTLIQGEISDVIGKYTADEIQPRTEDIKKEILSNIQEMYGSDFIYKITFSKLIVQ